MPAPLFGGVAHRLSGSADRLLALDVTTGRGIDPQMYRRVVYTTSQHLGFAPQMHGGFGPGRGISGGAFTAWHTESDRLVFLALDRGHLYLRIADAMIYEHAWDRATRWGHWSSGEWPLWLAIADFSSLPDLMLPGGSMVEDWTSLRSAIADMIVSLAGSHPAFDAGMTVPLLDASCQVLCRIIVDTDGDLLVSATADAVDGPTYERLLELGYTERLQVPPFDAIRYGRADDPRFAAEAAGLVVDTLRAWEVELPTWGNPSLMYTTGYITDGPEVDDLSIWGLRLPPY